MRTQSPPEIPRQPKAHLVDVLLRQETRTGLIETVQRLRAEDPPVSWTGIADRLTRWTGVNVSRQLLQQWARSWGEGKAA